MLRLAPILLLAMTGLSGCLAKTAYDVATAPVRVASKAVDWTTTSQEEADRNRGREIRRREERLGKLGREYESRRRSCERGNEEACEEARRLFAEMEELRPQVPYEPQR